MNLTTRYLGLNLRHPFFSGAGPLADDLDTVRQLEDAGAAAIVMRSLFGWRYGMASGFRSFANCVGIRSISVRA